MKKNRKVLMRVSFNPFIFLFIIFALVSCFGPSEEESDQSEFFRDKGDSVNERPLDPLPNTEEETGSEGEEDSSFKDEVVFTSESIIQKNTTYTDSIYGHNINLGGVCNPTGPNNSGVIHQVGKKMITVTTYPTNTSTSGTGVCVNSNEREPEYANVTFKCKADGTVDWSTTDFSNCVDFAERVYSCEEFGFPGVSATQNNLTVFTRSSDSIQARFQTDATWFDKLDRQYQMLGAICNSSNWGAECIVNPNSENCYGAFGHDSVNFPDQMFPTMLGGLKGVPPGYQGLNLPELVTPEEWDYFIVEPRYAPGYYSFNPSHTIGIRRETSFSINNFKTHTVNVSQFNPAAELALSRNALNYHRANAFRGNTAIKEFRYMRQHHYRSNKQYYYDHLPTVFYGKGELPNILNSSGQISSTRADEYFSRSCQYGCENLVITSHEVCDAIVAPDSDTHYVCLPANLDISIHHWSADSTLFDIKGYDDVNIYGLNFRVHGSHRFSEAYDLYNFKRYNNLWDDNLAKDLIDYLFPQISHYFDLADASNDIDYTVMANSIGTPYEIYPNFDADNGMHSLSNTLPPVVSFPDVGFTRSQAYTLERLFSGTTLKADLESLSSGFHKYLYEFMLTSGKSEMSWNFYYMLKPMKELFSIQNTHRLTVADTSVKSAVTNAFFYTAANKSIFHGVNLEGTSLQDFEDFGFVFNRDYINEKGHLFAALNNKSSITTNDVAKFSNFKRDYYIMGHGIVASNPGDQLRPDKLSLDESASSLASNFPLALNICRSISISSPLHTNAECSSDFNYDLDGLFSPNDFFNPFYFADEAVETRSPRIDFFDNSSYYRTFHLERHSSPYLQAARENPDNPIIITENTGLINASYNYASCDPAVDLGKSTSLGADDFCSHEHYYLSDAVDIDYLIVSNSTMKNNSNHNGRVKTSTTGSISLGGNHEFVQTVSVNALLFNNVFMNQQSDMYDLNFRRTNLRTEKNKNLFQHIERNIFAYGVQGKVTGAGSPEQIMKFSNNLFLKVPVGGYNGLFKSFYLHNGHLVQDELLEDGQQIPMMYDYLKPSGVRFALYNSSVLMSKNIFPSGGSLIYSANYRPKQHGFDYNFNYNLFLGERNNSWFTTWRGRAFSSVKTPLLNYAYYSAGCKTSSDNASFKNGCVTDTTDGMWNPRFSFLSSSDYSYAMSNLGFSTTATWYEFFGGLIPYLSSGSLSNHFYSTAVVDVSALDLFDTNVNFEEHQWGKMYPTTNNYLYNDLFLKNPILGHTPFLTNIEPASEIQSQRINFLWHNCYGNADPVDGDYSLSAFANDLAAGDAKSYRCVTGDTSSVFDHSASSIVDAIFSEFVDINILDDSEDYFDSSPGVLPSVEEIVNVFDIQKNSSSIGFNECDTLKSNYENNRAPAMHFDSLTLESGKKLSVYRDFSGVYRKASTTRGPFEIVGDSISCQ